MEGSMRQGHASLLERLSKALHLHYDEIANEALPRRWVDLIQHLDEEERRRSQGHQPGAEQREPHPRRKN
jgi:hypothetical protein